MALPRLPRWLVGSVTLALVAACSTADNVSTAIPVDTSVALTSETTTASSLPSTTVEPAPTAAPTTPATPPTTASTTTPPAPTDLPVSACLDRLSTEDKAALVVWPSVYAEDWERARSVVQDLGVGGVILMRPRLNESELTARVAELDVLSALGVLVATDEEGGDVQRLRDIQPFPSQYEMSTGFSTDAARIQVEEHAKLVARVGVDVVLGPVVDVLPEQGEPPLQRSRFFNGGPELVTSYAAAYIDGWESAGLTAVIKHFPGHGSASGDTHTAQGLTPALDILQSRDLVPYQNLAGEVSAVMVGHLTVPGLTDGRPATTSPEAIAYLRNTLGYGDVLVVSDALDMAAAGGSIATVAVASIAAGIDVVLFSTPSQAGAVIDAISAAVERGDLPTSRLDDAAGSVIRLLEARGGGCQRS